MIHWPFSQLFITISNLVQTSYVKFYISLFTTVFNTLAHSKHFSIFMSYLLLVYGDSISEFISRFCYVFFFTTLTYYAIEEILGETCHIMFHLKPFLTMFEFIF